MRIGYAYWGFLADEKFDNNGKEISTPDGNAFYSWSIINSLQEAGHIVYQMMPDRDRPITKFGGNSVKKYFSGMGFDIYESKDNPRYNAYVKMKKYLYDDIEDWKTVRQEELFRIWDSERISYLDCILLEWRMEIPNRNALNVRFTNIDWQPDLFIQNCIINYCASRNIKLIIFDLDYKLTEEHVKQLQRKNVDYFILELGNKWERESDEMAMHVEIPFDFRYINNISIMNTMADGNLVYVGNRYERDWCIDKYIPTEMHGVNIYGNWLEGGRDSQKRWPSINFHKRINASDMEYTYCLNTCTILLAKKEYVKYGFMTARIIESIYYGCLPLFIEEYGEDVIDKYAGLVKDELTVRDKGTVIDRVMYYKYHQEERELIIKYLREHLVFMHSKLFVETLEEVIRV